MNEEKRKRTSIPPVLIMGLGIKILSASKRYGHLAKEKNKKTLYTMESLILAQDER